MYNGKQTDPLGRDGMVLDANVICVIPSSVLVLICFNVVTLKSYMYYVSLHAGVVPCGSPKKRPRTPSIVQFIFYFWSFEIIRNRFVWLTLFLLNVFTALKGDHFYISLSALIFRTR